jgi:hypothetical protein
MPGRHPAFVLFTCCALVASSVPLPALADGHPRAATLKRRADAEMESLRYSEALDDYNEAYKLTRDPALLYNRSRVLEALARFPEALELLDQFTRDASPELKARVPKLAELRTELRSHIASLSIRCAVNGARVLVDKRLVATTPVTDPVPLNAGAALLEVIADGYAAFQQRINLPKAGTLELEVRLEARKTSGASGQLSVSATPEGSDVFVDGKPFGQAPAEGEVAPGRHEVVVSHAGFRDAKVSATVAEEQRRELTLTLEKTSPITSRWWFWTTGIVVVGATAAAIGIAVAAHKSAGHGDISPGQISAPGP